MNKKRPFFSLPNSLVPSYFSEPSLHKALCYQESHASHSHNPLTGIPLQVRAHIAKLECVWIAYLFNVCAEETRHRETMHVLVTLPRHFGRHHREVTAEVDGRHREVTAEVDVPFGFLPLGLKIHWAVASSHADAGWTCQIQSHATTSCNDYGETQLFVYTDKSTGNVKLLRIDEDRATMVDGGGSLVHEMPRMSTAPAFDSTHPPRRLRLSWRIDVLGFVSRGLPDAPPFDIGLLHMSDAFDFWTLDRRNPHLNICMRDRPRVLESETVPTSLPASNHGWLCLQTTGNVTLCIALWESEEDLFLPDSPYTVARSLAARDDGAGVLDARGLVNITVTPDIARRFMWFWSCGMKWGCRQDATMELFEWMGAFYSRH